MFLRLSYMARKMLSCRPAKMDEWPGVRKRVRDQVELKMDRQIAEEKKRSDV